MQRNTRQKEAVLEVIQGVGKHMTAEQVHEAVQEIEPGVGLATIYRNLNTLCEQKIIMKVSGNGWSYFDGNSEPHDHFFCRQCGKLQDIPCYEADSFKEFMHRRITGKVERLAIIYEGLCGECVAHDSVQTS